MSGWNPLAKNFLFTREHGLACLFLLFLSHIWHSGQASLLLIFLCFLSFKTKTCRSALAHYLFVKMQLCQSLAMHILLCVFMIISATHTLCYPPNHYPDIYIDILVTSILLVDRPLKKKVIFYSFSFSPVQLKKSMSDQAYCTSDTITSYFWHSLQREKHLWSYTALSSSRDIKGRHQ